MKKFILTALVLLGISFAASAQKYQVIYVEDIDDETVVIHPSVWIDRAAKKILFYDPEDPVNIETLKENPNTWPENNIQSIKKEGNKETIIYTQPNYPVEFKIELVINPNLTSKDDLSGQSITHSSSHAGVMEKHKAFIYDQLPDEEKNSIEYQRKWREQEAARKSGAATSATPSSNNSGNSNDAKDPAGKLLDKGKDGVKNLLNKGKDLIKKK